MYYIVAVQYGEVYLDETADPTAVGVDGLSHSDWDRAILVMRMLTNGEWKESEEL